MACPFHDPVSALGASGLRCPVGNRRSQSALHYTHNPHHSCWGRAGGVGPGGGTTGLAPSAGGPFLWLLPQGAVLRAESPMRSGPEEPAHPPDPWQELKATKTAQVPQASPVGLRGEQAPGHSYRLLAPQRDPGAGLLPLATVVLAMSECRGLSLGPVRSHTFWPWQACFSGGAKAVQPNAPCLLPTHPAIGSCVSPRRKDRGALPA